MNLGRGLVNDGNFRNDITVDGKVNMVTRPWRNRSCNRKFIDGLTLKLSRQP